MEKWINFIQTNSEILTKAAIVALSLLVLFYLARILRQIKRLNRSLGSITENIQAYFDVILQEEEPKMQKEPEEEVAVAATAESCTGENEDAGEQKLTKQEEEEVFNAVLQEYFS